MPTYKKLTKFTVTAFNTTLESGHSSSLSFELQESLDLKTWEHVAFANPRGPIYFTRFKTYRDGP